MFGRKQAEINRLKNINEQLRADVHHHLDRQIALAKDIDKLEISNTQLVRDLREMDQLIFQMSQSLNPEQLRSAVARASAITKVRMEIESARIADMLIPEIKKVYSDANPPQGLPSMAPRTCRLTKG